MRASLRLDGGGLVGLLSLLGLPEVRDKNQGFCVVVRENVLGVATIEGVIGVFGCELEAKRDWVCGFGEFPSPVVRSKMVSTSMSHPAEASQESRGK